MKMAGLLGATGFTSTAGFSSEVRADHYSEEENRGKYSSTKEVYYEDCDNSSYEGQQFMENSGVSLVYFSTFDNNSGQVLHHFGASGHVGTRWRNSDPEIDDDWSEVDAVGRADLNIWNLDDNGSLLAPQENDDRMVGATPEDGGSDYNYEDAAYTALKEVIANMHPAISAVVGAHEVTDALMGHEKDEDGQRVEYSWDYSSWGTGDTADASNFCRFYIETDESYNKFDVQVESDMASAPDPSCPKMYGSDDDTLAAVRLAHENPEIESQTEPTEVDPEELPPGIPEDFVQDEPITEYQLNMTEVEPKQPPEHPSENGNSPVNSGKSDNSK